jgi:hypothetical protein
MSQSLEINNPEVVKEVTELFERYEKAIADKNIEVLDATFWNSPHTVRYAMHEHGYGFNQIHDQRVARRKGSTITDKVTRQQITTIGRDVAVTILEFSLIGRPEIARQSQMWVRFPDVGWKVIHAHVSTSSQEKYW